MLDRKRFPISDGSKIKYVDFGSLADFSTFKEYTHNKQIAILLDRVSLVVLRSRDQGRLLTPEEKTLLTDIDQTIRAITAEWESSLPPKGTNTNGDNT